MKTTAENNRLIAEFMGYQVVNKPKVVEGENFFQYLDEKTNKYAYCASLLMYNYSWDWLMPVVEKIEGLGYGVTIGMGMYCVIQDETTENDIEFTGMENSKLLSTYKACIQFIEWYNENK